ncbi:collagen alpha-1(I) chain-like [Monodon monoceros]|uniref:collagen alpha-1(I) chain-like n=1 Tax=Monodon monoceros TaxID=40151 RepID=UPI0010FA4A2B|nr:collagen alpha-1(I) chain-like [Monodon monoceros]
MAVVSGAPPWAPQKMCGPTAESAPGTARGGRGRALQTWARRHQVGLGQPTETSPAPADVRMAPGTLEAPGSGLAPRRGSSVGGSVAGVPGAPAEGGADWEGGERRSRDRTEGVGSAGGTALPVLSRAGPCSGPTRCRTPEQGPPAWPDVALELGTLRDQQTDAGTDAQVRTHLWLGPDSGLRPAGSEPGRCEQDPGDAPSPEAPRQVPLGQADGGVPPELRVSLPPGPPSAVLGLSHHRVNAGQGCPPGLADTRARRKTLRLSAVPCSLRFAQTPGGTGPVLSRPAGAQETAQHLAPNSQAPEPSALKRDSLDRQAVVLAHPPQGPPGWAPLHAPVLLGGTAVPTCIGLSQGNTGRCLWLRGPEGGTQWCFGAVHGVEPPTVPGAGVGQTEEVPSPSLESLSPAGLPSPTTRSRTWALKKRGDQEVVGPAGVGGHSPKTADTLLCPECVVALARQREGTSLGEALVDGRGSPGPHRCGPLPGKRRWPGAQGRLGATLGLEGHGKPALPGTGATAFPLWVGFRPQAVSEGPAPGPEPWVGTKAALGDHRRCSCQATWKLLCLPWDPRPAPALVSGLPSKPPPTTLRGLNEWAATGTGRGPGAWEPVPSPAGPPPALPASLSPAAAARRSRLCPPLTFSCADTSCHQRTALQPRPLPSPGPPCPVTLTTTHLPRWSRGRHPLLSVQPGLPVTEHLGMPNAQGWLLWGHGGQAPQLPSPGSCGGRPPSRRSSPCPAGAHTREMLVDTGMSARPPPEQPGPAGRSEQRFNQGRPEVLGLDECQRQDPWKGASLRPEEECAENPDPGPDSAPSWCRTGAGKAPSPRLPRLPRVPRRGHEMPGLVVSSPVVDGHTQLEPVQVLCQRLPRLKSVVPGQPASQACVSQGSPAHALGLGKVRRGRSPFGPSGPSPSMPPQAPQLVQGPASPKQRHPGGWGSLAGTCRSLTPCPESQVHGVVVAPRPLIFSSCHMAWSLDISLSTPPTGTAAEDSRPPL